MPEKASPALETLAGNLAKLMQGHAVLNSQSAVGRAAKVDQKTIGRILLKQHEPQIDKVQKIAKAFNLELWQLLQPDLQPGEAELLLMVAALDPVTKKAVIDSVRGVFAGIENPQEQPPPPKRGLNIRNRLPQHLGPPLQEEFHADPSADVQDKKGT